MPAFQPDKWTHADRVRPIDFREGEQIIAVTDDGEYYGEFLQIDYNGWIVLRDSYDNQRVALPSSAYVYRPAVTMVFRQMIAAIALW